MDGELVWYEARLEGGWSLTRQGFDSSSIRYLVLSYQG